MVNQLFVNLSVKDLNKTVEFFTQLGFTFNPQFTNENATCMIIGENLFAMLLVEKFFQSFSKKEICDTSKSAEAIMALSVDSREKVDEMVHKAIKAGGTAPSEKQDQGFMYGWGFQDLDGHLWEVFHMNMDAVNQG